MPILTWCWDLHSALVVLAWCLLPCLSKAVDFHCFCIGMNKKEKPNPMGALDRWWGNLKCSSCWLFLSWPVIKEFGKMGASKYFSWSYISGFGHSTLLNLGEGNNIVQKTLPFPWLSELSPDDLNCDPLSVNVCNAHVGNGSLLFSHTAAIVAYSSGELLCTSWGLSMKAS